MKYKKNRNKKNEDKIIKNKKDNLFEPQEVSPFLKVICYLSNNICEKNLYITVYSEDRELYRNTGLSPEINAGTFFTDNYMSLFFFGCRVEENLKKDSIVVVTVRKFEKGPKEPISNLPYKTVSQIIWDNSQKIWHVISEEETKIAYSFDGETGKPLKLEHAILFSNIFESLPEIKNVAEFILNERL